MDPMVERQPGSVATPAAISRYGLAMGRDRDRSLVDWKTSPCRPVPSLRGMAAIQRGMVAIQRQMVSMRHTPEASCHDRSPSRRGLDSSIESLPSSRDADLPAPSWADAPPEPTSDEPHIGDDNP